MKRTQALERLEELTNELNNLVQSKVNIHKEIKTKATSVTNALRRFKKLDEEWRLASRRTPRATPGQTNQVVVVTDEAMDTGAEGDGESVIEDKRETVTKTGKRKDRSSPDPTCSQVTKKKDLRQSPPQRATMQRDERTKAIAWQKVQSKKEQRRQRKEQLPKQFPEEPRPEPKRKKSRKWIRPDALIIRPAEPAKYAEILRKIKNDVPDEQVRTTVDKIHKTRAGNMLITLSRKSSDKGQALQKTIEGILQEEAKCKSSVDRSKLYIRCGQEGHKIAGCKNPAKCALCAENQSAENSAHYAGNHKCPVFQEALQRLINKRT
ncbi:triadin-like [Cotesia glomerata]|uniref:triadin-like n=1 Tax=Cotesia glomerata TaxID=32391 RepID=UPI001D031342|nr:triadin-like [Cotesia glomerata]